jgi:hypothetical protein
VHRNKTSSQPSDKGGRLKTKLYDKRDDLTFPIVNFPSSVAIFQHHQRMEFEFEKLAPLSVASLTPSS